MDTPFLQRAGQDFPDVLRESNALVNAAVLRHQLHHAHIEPESAFSAGAKDGVPRVKDLEI